MVIVGGFFFKYSSSHLFFDCVFSLSLTIDEPAIYKFPANRAYLNSFSAFIIKAKSLELVDRN